MKKYANKLDELSRRGFIADTAKACFGVTIGGSLAQKCYLPIYVRRAYAS